MNSLEKSEYPDEMPHNAAFHQGLRYLLDHPDFIFIVCSFMKNSIVLKKVNYKYQFSHYAINKSIEICPDSHVLITYFHYTFRPNHYRNWT